jgi:hypothetical protein
MLWTFAITSIALFMVTLDNLVVTTALPVIRRDLGASLQELARAQDLRSPTHLRELRTPVPASPPSTSPATWAPA